MAGLQTVTTPVGGTVVSSTTFGVPVANNLTVLAQPPVARMRASTAVSIPTGANTAMTWNTEDSDTVGGHSTSTNTSRYTVQAGYAGYYQADATIWFTGNATGNRHVLFAVNGSVIAASGGGCAASNGVAMSASASLKWLLAAGDFIEVFVLQASGGALLTVETADTASCFEIEWVHQ